MSRARKVTSSVSNIIKLPKIETYLSQNPILHSPTINVQRRHEKLPIIIQNLKTIASKIGFVSLSANQISYQQSVFVCLNKQKIKPNQWSTYQNVLPQDYEAIVNPKVTVTCPIQQYAYQQCSSMRGFKFPVKRPVQVQFQFQNQKRIKLQQLINGFRARVWLHQMTHMQGKLIIDTVFCNGQVQLGDYYALPQHLQGLYNIKTFMQQNKRELNVIKKKLNVTPRGRKI